MQPEYNVPGRDWFRSRATQSTSTRPPAVAFAGRKPNPVHATTGNLYNKGVHVRKRSVLLCSAASGAIVLSTFAAALPANAASLPAAAASTNASSSAGSLSPASVGSILCSGDLCIQRITSVVNGTASVKAWADTYSFTGSFYLSGGPDGYDRSSTTGKWNAGGTGYVFTDVPEGATYTATAWTTGGDEIGLVTFGVFT